MIWALLFGLLACMQPGQGLYHEKSAFWIEPPKPVPREDAYFGYSVTYESTSKQVIASAPQEDNIGQIYSCDIEKTYCSKMNHNISRVDANYAHNYWYGAVVKANSGIVVTCAPLYVERQQYNFSSNNYYMGTFSRCFKYTSLTQNPVQLSLINKYEKKNHTTHFEQMMDSFGWSIDIFGKYTIIGSPAMFTGRVMMYQDSKMIHTNTKLIPNGIKYEFGYSVALGNFRYAGNHQPTYAVGSPYGSDGHGAVAFYPIADKQDEITCEGTLKNKKDDNIVGSMFGAVLCAARLYSNSRDALIIGAPTYATENTYNKGAVFIYEPGSLPLMKFLRKIEGKKSGGYFGSSIASIGDLNGDKRHEIAIAAPYENSLSASQGVVYIYSSVSIFSDKKYIEPLQSIVAEAQSFGLSLTPLLNHFEKGCNELAIGAPYSNKVKILKCVPAIIVKVSRLTVALAVPATFVPPNSHECACLGSHTRHALQYEVQKFNESSSQLITRFCLTVTYPKGLKTVKQHIDVKVDVEHTNVKLANAADSKIQLLIKKDATEDLCREITLNKPTIGNYNQCIKYNLTASVPDTENVMMKENIGADHVVVSDKSELVSTGGIWLSDCIDKSNCIPNLKYLGTTWTREDKQIITSPYMIGSSKEVLVNIHFRNDGEVAYDSCIRVRVNGTTISMPSTVCELETSDSKGLICSPKQALKNNTPWSTQEISLRTEELTSESKQIEIRVEIYNKCTEQDKAAKKDYKEETLDLKPDFSKITITGITNLEKDNTVYVTQAENDMGNVFFNQIYTIVNNDHTWKYLTALVIVQKKEYIAIEKDITVKEGFAGKKESDLPETCIKVNENTTTETYSCNVGTLSRDKPSKRVTIHISVKNVDLESIIQANNNKIQSTLLLQVNGMDPEAEPKMLSIVSILVLEPEVKVAWWIILIAVLMGFLVLLILVFLLRELGFFRRDKKQELKKVERSVKRQTVIRRSMMERCPPAPDQLTLMDDDIGEAAAAAVTVKPRPETRVKVFPE